MNILITGGAKTDGADSSDLRSDSRGALCFAALAAIAFAALQVGSAEAQTPTDLFAQALQEEQQLNISSAQDKLQEAIQQQPELPGLREHAAWQNYLTGYHDEETLSLLEAAAPTSKDPEAVRGAIRHVRKQLGKEDGADPAPAVRPIQAPAPDNYAARLQYARELYWSGSPAEAKEVLGSLIAKKPQEAVLRLEMARVLAALKDQKAATAEAKTARDLRPGDARLQKALERITAAGPAVAVAPSRSARTADKRAAHSTRSASAPPGGGSRAANLFQSGRQAEANLDLFGAREFYREALRSNPNLPGLRDHTAWFLFLNDFHNRECLDLFEASLPTASDKAATRTAIGMLRQELGLEPATKQAPAAAPQRAPSSSSGAARLAYARQLFWSGSPQESQAVLEELVAQRPNEPALHLALGNVLMARNDYKSAAGELKTAQQLRPQEPEIALALSRAEAMRGRRTAAIRALNGVEITDEGQLHLARAQAHHYAAEFFPASHEYRKAMAARPYDEIAAHGLAETSLRNGSVPEARALLATWPGVSLQTDWSERLTLESEVAAPRLRAGASYFGNSLDYYNWNVGSDFRFRPLDALELGFLATYGSFQQSGFSTINRVTGMFSAVWQPTDLWALSGHVGVNGYDTGWTSVTGGIGVMVRPFSSLQLDVTADHMDAVDSEPVLGASIYDLASTIGAVGGRATMDVLGIAATWTPVERLKLFGKYRLATLTGNSTMNDYYIDASYLVWRRPDVRFGYGLSQTMFSAAAPVYREGNNSTSYYYDPENLIVQNFYGEFAWPVTKKLTVGGEGHFYQQPLNGGIGTGIFGFLRYDFADNQSFRIDARWFSQDRGLNRDGSSSGFYNALNLVAVYEIRF